MNSGIRLRFAVWLLAALVPVGIAAIFVFGRIEDDVSARVATDLEAVRGLEASRIESALASYRDHGRTLASGIHVVDMTTGVLAAHETGSQSGTIGGVDGFSAIDAFEERPLQELVQALQRKTNSTTAEVAAMRIVGRNGVVLGETAGFDWEPFDETLVDRAMEASTIRIGNAFRDADGQDRVGVVVPIVSPNNAVVGALLLENELGPIVDLTVAHESFGATSEAHLAQRTPDGTTQFITPLRFDRDAAFTRAISSSLDVPINQSLDAPNGVVLFSKDYRGEESILAVETLHATGWGLVVKIDTSEALEPVLLHTKALKGVAGLGLLAVLLGWGMLLDPVARRLRRLADGAERVANGDYETPLDDRSSDEIGSVATSIDRLATDLAADIAVRTDVETRLRHQATHDATTGLFNRQFATNLMDKLANAVDNDEAESFSLLFLDLDNFKAINDDYGHPTGDAVLAATAQRISSAAGQQGTVARWGGDEFVVILPRTTELGATAMALKVKKSLRTPFVIDGVIHDVRASIGTSTRRAGTAIESVLNRADEAMFAEKQTSGASRANAPAFLRDVQRAIVDRSVEVWFQPVVSGSGDTVSLHGAEALVRLRDENGEVIAPGEFLFDIDRSPLGRDLDRLVMATSLRQVAAWIDDRHLASNFRLSVNCCEAMMCDPATPAFIAGLLRETSLTPRNLMIELRDLSPTLNPSIITELDAMGVKIAVDDPGLGEQDAHRLLGDGLSVAKVDRRWLQSDTPSEQAANDEMLRQFVDVCDANGFDIIAEGIETPEQYAQMCALGVSTFQGFLFARPLSVDDFASRFLHRG